jgi:hypothetical protein
MEKDKNRYRNNLSRSDRRKKFNSLRKLSFYESRINQCLAILWISPIRIDLISDVTQKIKFQRTNEQITNKYQYTMSKINSFQHFGIFPKGCLWQIFVNCLFF